MRPTACVLISLLLATLVVGSALAQDFIIYPGGGQSQEQMEKDKFECYQWAKGQTGFDPMETPKATEPPPPQQAQRSAAGGAVRGGVGGAALGAGIGAIAGGSKGAKKGAAIGGISGGVLGGARSQAQKKQDEQAQQQWADQQTGQYMQKRDTYNRAYKACLEGKGYTVK
jgi:predicted lipid-binding transport protein (Tim44 family)